MKRCTYQPRDEDRATTAQEIVHGIGGPATCHRRSQIRCSIDNSDNPLISVGGCWVRIILPDVELLRETQIRYDTLLVFEN
jgi:hypothetical protein